MISLGILYGDVQLIIDEWMPDQRLPIESSNNIIQSP